jgi:hypothetical protein
LFFNTLSILSILDPLKTSQISHHRGRKKSFVVVKKSFVVVKKSFVVVKKSFSVVSFYLKKEFFRSIFLLEKRVFP